MDALAERGADLDLQEGSGYTALMLVMLGSKKPVIPTYPSDHPLAQLKRK